MPYRKYIPAADAACLAWCGTFASVLVADPARFGVTPADVAPLPPLVEGFRAALYAATDPGTRTRTVVLAKREARAALESEVRRLVKLIRARVATFPDATQRLLELGLPDPAPAGRSGRTDPPPEARPLLVVVREGLASVALSVQPYVDAPHPAGGGSTPISDALPPRAAGVMLFYAMVPPNTPIPPHHTSEDLTRWRFLTLTTKRRLKLRLPTTPEDQGTTPVLLARYYNRKGQPGPISTPVFAQLAA